MVLEKEIKQYAHSRRPEHVLKYLAGCLRSGYPISVDEFHKLRAGRVLTGPVLRAIQRLNRYAKRKSLDEVDAGHLHLISLYAKRALAEKSRQK